VARPTTPASPPQRAVTSAEVDLARLAPLSPDAPGAAVGRTPDVVVERAAPGHSGAPARGPRGRGSSPHRQTPDPLAHDLDTLDAHSRLPGADVR
jgi:hypothetical protein